MFATWFLPCWALSPQRDTCPLRHRLFLSLGIVKNMFLGSLQSSEQDHGMAKHLHSRHSEVVFVWQLQLHLKNEFCLLLWKKSVTQKGLLKNFYASHVDVLTTCLKAVMSLPLSQEGQMLPGGRPVGPGPALHKPPP